MTDLSMTEQRLQALNQAKVGAIAYDPVTASWLIDGQSVSGWQGRTLSELRRAGYLKVTPSGKPSTPSTVELSQKGWEVVSS